MSDDYPTIEETSAERVELFEKIFEKMTPERFVKHTNDTRVTAMQHGREVEREELVCRLLASEMPVEEIAVVLCLRTDAVRLIESNYSTTKIPEYAKKLKERRKRRERKI